MCGVDALVLSVAAPDAVAEASIVFDCTVPVAAIGLGGEEPIRAGFCDDPPVTPRLDS